MRREEHTLGVDRAASPGAAMSPRHMSPRHAPLSAGSLTPASGAGHPASSPARPRSYVTRRAKVTGERGLPLSPRRPCHGRAPGRPTALNYSQAGSTSRRPSAGGRGVPRPGRAVASGTSPATPQRSRPRSDARSPEHTWGRRRGHTPPQGHSGSGSERT